MSFQKTDKEIAKNDRTLRRLLRQWKRLKILGQFPRCHHYSQKGYKMDPMGLWQFVRDCQGKALQGENLQTMERAEFVVLLIEQEKLHKPLAVKLAWEHYPLVTAPTDNKKRRVPIDG